MGTEIREPREWVADKRAFAAWLPRRAVCCEVGVWRGDFAAVLLDSADPVRLWLVDPWSAQPREQYDDPMNGDQAHWDAVFAGVALRFEGEPRVRIMRDYSVLAATRFVDASLDWIYLDANHAYEAIREDLRAWWPKIKPDGLLCGHDYIEPELAPHPVGVVRAVNEFIDQTGAVLECLAEESHPNSWRSYALRMA